MSKDLSSDHNLGYLLCGDDTTQLNRNFNKPFTRIPINRPVQWNARPYLFLVLYLHDFLRQKRQFAMGKYAQTINQATKPVIM